MYFKVFLRKLYNVCVRCLLNIFQCLNYFGNIPLHSTKYHKIIYKCVDALSVFMCCLHKVGTNRDGTISYLEFLEKYHQRGGTPDGLRMLGSLQK